MLFFSSHDMAYSMCCYVPQSARECTWRITVYKALQRPLHLVTVSQGELCQTASLRAYAKA